MQCECSAGHLLMVQHVTVRPARPWWGGRPHMDSGRVHVWPLGDAYWARSSPVASRGRADHEKAEF